VILSDRELDALTPDVVAPFHEAALQPSSIDLTLGDELLVLPYGVTIDPEVDQSDLWQAVPLRDDGRWLIGGHRLYLGVTAETVTMPPDCVGFLHGVSTLGRMGLVPHAQAGLVDPGWRGRLTLELILCGQAMLLRPEMRIAQLTIHRLSSCAERSYTGRYQSDTRPTPARVVP
jgi:dCTP deaminase